MKNTKYSILILIFAFVVFLSGCDNNNDPGILPDVNLVIQINHLVDGQPLTLNSKQYQTAFGNTYSIETLVYFISRFELSGDFDGVATIDEVHYVDVTTPASLRFESETTFPLLEYNKIKMVFGLDESDNTPGAFPNPPENNMEWPVVLGDGYHYMKFEGKFDSADIVKNFQTHTGPTNGNQNYISLDLPITSFTTDENTFILQMDFDLNKWYENPHTIDLNDMSRIMPNQDKQLLLKANGQDIISF